MDYDLFFKNQLDSLKNEGRYRTFANLKRITSRAPYALWNPNHANQTQSNEDDHKEVVVWCSNDYLGMSHNKSVIEAMVSSVQTFGAGSGGTRNISGTAHSHVMLEKEVAQLHQKQSALTFMSGYVANDATLTTLGSGLKNCVMFSDEKNHASIIRGIKHSGAQKEIFRHHDMAHLESLLQKYPLETPKIIITVSVASMDGTFPPLEKMCYLAKKYNALTYLDEVHGVGIYGKHGAGVAQFMNLTDQIDIIQGNFAKGYGVVGGYIASTNHLVDYVRSNASGFIFTTSLPPCVADAARASIQYLKNNPDRRALLWKRVNQLKAAFKSTLLPILNTPSHIVPLIVGDAHKCKALSDRLLHEHNIYIQPINFPTVPKGTERFRITITPDHTPEMIEDLVSSLSTLWKDFDLPLRNENVIALPSPVINRSIPCCMNNTCPYADNCEHEIYEAGMTTNNSLNF